MTEDQKTVAGLVMAALTEDHDGLAHLVNDLPNGKVRPASAHALTLLASIFRAVIAPDDWQALIQEARASRALLDLDDPTEATP
ncbi:hypothetical protein [Streptomyces sp. PSKA30]|uniref:hypothetical protein n=1 Tax=Streptomyces sp. PSKA30 TaxID=2874597 RepID=UPI001CD13D09|nr:hypothetical protein [Streptomyces sp. PSKA30]MBZ9638009.1 hypothetical protein [Streptomyces sp. PSKA30]